MRLLGTPLYMAPERLRDPSDVDFRSDIYSVGVVAFFILTGRKMFQTDDTLALTSCVLHEVPPRVSAVATQPIPEELDLLIESCLHKRREDRPQRITDMVDTPESISRTHRWTQSDAEAAWVHAGEEDPGRARASS
ncbi:MAG: protein kinase [Gammaproteobacteria bacterium]|nr:protein kinase [Gammaproteobacteria bacterium]